MRSALTRSGLSLAALAAVALLAGCASGELEAKRQAEAEAARIAAEIAARTPPPVNLDPAIADAASIYLAFARDMQTIRGGFATPEAVQAALRRSAAYDPEQISRGLVAYASILALQSPEFVASVQRYAVNPSARQKLAADIAADPRYASYIPGAEKAAGLITATLRADIQALGDAADSIENDAYTIQAADDPRQGWGRSEVADREGRLARVKLLSTQTMAPSATDAAALLAAAGAGAGLAATPGDDRSPPYSPVVANALAIAALAALGVAGPEARPVVDSMVREPVGERCLAMSKLNLYQCLAASRPSYEDIFCIGRHAVRDLATCVSGAAMPAAIVTVSGLRATPAPPVRPVPFEPPPAAAPAASPPPISPARLAPAPARTPAAGPPVSPTERLNTQPATPDR